MSLSANLTLEILNKPFLLEKRIDLLIAIKEFGSINKAAKKVPLSYKAAWEAIEDMNNLSNTPIVVKETGGTGGGGTKLTEYGENLLNTYLILKEEQKKFLESLNRITDINSGTLKTIRRLSMQLSARNQIVGKIIDIKFGSINAQISLELKNNKKLISIITLSSVENLDLKVNDEVIALIKSSNVLISTDTNLKISARNSLRGKIESINKGDVNSEVVIDILNGDKVVTVLTTSSLDNLGLKVGLEVDAIIKASDVMIGK